MSITLPLSRSAKKVAGQHAATAVCKNAGSREQVPAGLCEQSSNSADRLHIDHWAEERIVTCRTILHDPVFFVDKLQR